MEQIFSQSLNKDRQFECVYQNKAYLLCCSELCKANAFICTPQKCKCYNQDHIQCLYLGLNNLLQKLQSKKKNPPENKKKALESVIKIYQEIIDLLKQDLHQILQQIDNGDLQENQVKFMKLIESSNYSQIDGDLVSKVKLEFSKIPQQNQNQYFNEKQIQNIWEKNKKQLEKIKATLKEMTFRQKKTLLNSKITNEQPLIRSFLGGQFPSYTLLYRASENNFQVKKFHQKCDGKSHTLLIALTQFDKIIGGYTPLTWNSTGSWLSDKTQKTFMFSITNKQKYPMESTSSTIIFCHSSYGPTFHDLHIRDKSNTAENSSEAYFPQTFNNGKYTNNQESYRAFSGAKNGYYCKIKQWQVYEVKFI